MFHVMTAPPFVNLDPAGVLTLVFILGMWGKKMERLADQEAPQLTLAHIYRMVQHYLIALACSTS